MKNLRLFSILALGIGLVILSAMDQEPREGRIKVLIMFANVNGIPNNAEQSRRDAWVADTESYYRYASYGKCRLEITQTPTLDVNANTNEQLQSRMRQAAAIAGYDPTDYEVLVYNFPPNSAGSIAGGAVASRNLIIFPGNFESSGLIHEMGHALGVGHPRTIEAGSQAYPSQQGDQYAGVEAPFNMMGSGAGVGSGSGNWNNPNNLSTWNLPQKYKVGWINDTELHDARSTGIYRIYTNDLAGDLVSGRKYGARIRLGTSTTFDPGTQTPNIFISYQAGNTYRSDEAVRGVVLEVLNREITFLIDATPESVPPLPTVTNVHPESGFGDLIDSHLTVGHTLELPSLGYRVSVVQHGGSGDEAWIDVRVEENSTASSLPPSLSVRHQVPALPRESDTSSPLPLAQLSILGVQTATSDLSLSGTDAALFQLSGTALELRSGVNLNNLSAAELEVTVTLDDPDFSGVEGQRDLFFSLTDDFLFTATDTEVGNNGLKLLTYAATTQQIPAQLPAVTNETSTADVIIPPRTTFDKHGYEFSGFIEVPHDGLYRFHSTNSFHGRLFLDGTLVIDTNDDEGSIIEAGDAPSNWLSLQAGPHFFRYIWFGNDRNNLSLNLEWQGPGISRRRIPTSVYFLNPSDAMPDPGNQPPTPGGESARHLSIDLADLVGGGDGSFPGTATQDSVVGRGQVTFSPQSSPFIDGTFIPLASGNTTISSTGLQRDFSSFNSAEVAGDPIRNGYSQEALLSGNIFNSVQIPNLNDTQNHSVLDLHSSQGITFDLSEIEAATSSQVVRFRTIAAGPTGETTSYAVLLDGSPQVEDTLDGQSAALIDFVIPTSSTFLTLVSGDNNAGTVNNRHTVFINPFLIKREQAPPKISNFSLSGSNLSFRLETRLGERYRLWSSETLLPNSWSLVPDVDPIIGDGTVQPFDFIDFIPDDLYQQFFQIRFE